MPEQKCGGSLSLYMNRETGEVLTRREMLKQFSEDYDGGDPTNALSWAEYYEEVRNERRVD